MHSMERESWPASRSLLSKPTTSHNIIYKCFTFCLQRACILCFTIPPAPRKFQVTIDPVSHLGGFRRSLVPRRSDLTPVSGDITFAVCSSTQRPPPGAFRCRGAPCDGGRQHQAARHVAIPGTPGCKSPGAASGDPADSAARSPRGRPVPGAGDAGRTAQPDPTTERLTSSRRQSPPRRSLVSTLRSRANLLGWRRPGWGEREPAVAAGSCAEPMHATPFCSLERGSGALKPARDSQGHGGGRPAVPLPHPRGPRSRGTRLAARSAAARSLRPREGERALPGQPARRDHRGTPPQPTRVPGPCVACPGGRAGPWGAGEGRARRSPADAPADRLGAAPRTYLGPGAKAPAPGARAAAAAGPRRGCPSAARSSPPAGALAPSGGLALLQRPVGSPLVACCCFWCYPSRLRPVGKELAGTPHSVGFTKI